jgi:hypothetical protein
VEDVISSYSQGILYIDRFILNKSIDIRAKSTGKIFNFFFSILSSSKKDEEVYNSL